MPAVRSSGSLSSISSRSGQAAAAQWDRQIAVPWTAEFNLPDEVEDAVVQVMTYLIENETAALIIPSRFIAQLHPSFPRSHAGPRDTGRRRGTPHRGLHAPPAAEAHGTRLSTSGGQASLRPRRTVVAKLRSAIEDLMALPIPVLDRKLPSHSLTSAIMALAELEPARSARAS